jgi:protein-glutamine gamma-glutamyltransferase
MDHEQSPIMRRVTFCLVALSAFAVEVAADDLRPVMASLGLASIWIGISVFLNFLIPLPSNPRKAPPNWMFGVMLALATAPFIIETIRRSLTAYGSPLELQMVYGLRNVGLGLAVLGGWVLYLRLACVISLFLMLFSAAMTNHLAVMILLGCYTATGSVWLWLVYWSGLKAILVEVEQTVLIEAESQRHRLPWIGISILIFAVSSSVVLAIVGPKQAAFALGELMPTSGGTGDTDPFARYGIGDGPEETSGDNAKAAGMVESEKMIEDNKNSLIDAVNDMYGPPHKPPKDQERMVAAGKVDVIENHGKLPENRRPSRDFDTSRKGRASDRKPESQGARGLFEVEGKTPLHIRMIAYDRYDVAEKRWLQARTPTSLLLDATGNDWMKLVSLKPTQNWYHQEERHKLKVADLNSNLVPTPSMLTQFRIHRVDKPGYYEWDYEGVIALAGRKRTPPGVVVTTDSQTVDPMTLPESCFGKFPDIAAIPEEIRTEILQLASTWAAEKPRGWPQIQAILDRLHSEFGLDPMSTAPVDHPHPVLWFLNESRRGPDYLFATAATLLLRSLDYPARVCLGYYASPSAYDPESAHTPVRKTDLHTWAEVKLTDGQWLIVEATPGYAVLPPKLSLQQRIMNGLQALFAWTKINALILFSSMSMLVWVWVSRKRWIDFLAVLWLQLFPRKNWQDQVLKTVSILERRGRWSGQERLPQQTSVSWLRKRLELSLLTEMLEWASYASRFSPPWPEDDIRDECKRMIQAWPLRRWYAINSSSERVGV